MNGLNDLVWFVLAGIVMPTILVVLLDRRRARDEEHTADVHGGARRDREKK